MQPTIKFALIGALSNEFNLMTNDPPVISLREIQVRFGKDPLLDGANLQLIPGSRTCLVGRNGSGKSTIMKIIAGLFEPDNGQLYFEPGLTIGYLQQDVPLPNSGNVASFVANTGHTEAARFEVDDILSRLDIDGDRDISSLSGGESRRTALARSLLGNPDILLLDEPTNHLDLQTIQWLEQTLLNSKTTILVVSHDRAFLKKITTDTLWVHHNQLLHNKNGYTDFDRWSEAILDDEVKAEHKLRQKIRSEEHWLVYGVTARRKRNQGRLKSLEQLRERRRATLKGETSVNIDSDSGPISGRLVIEAKELVKSYKNKNIVSKFSTRILKGDRIGFIGPNGAGKTTLLNLLIGNLSPDSGRLRLGSNLTIALFDQTRQSLNLDETLWQTLVPEGGDSLNVRGKQRHVVAYLRDFLFDEKQAKSPVSSLSGGEKNRLLLAKILAQPSNLLVLDEPTNDLDSDTLDVLQEMLDDYDGTLLLVSHDREFLDRIVTSTIAIESNGIITEYAGGYSDYLYQKKDQKRSIDDTGSKKRKKTQKNSKFKNKTLKKLSYNDQRELEKLPKIISNLQAAKKQIESILADPNLYTQDALKYNDNAEKLKKLNVEIIEAEDRWLCLETALEDLSK